MILFVAINLPPVLVVNENVAALEFLAATRSVGAMAKMQPPMLPEPILTEGLQFSAPIASSVCTWMLPPVIAAPMVNPLTVIPEPVEAVLAAMDPADIVITIWVDPGAATDSVVPTYDAVTLEEEKNAAG